MKRGIGASTFAFTDTQGALVLVVVVVVVVRCQGILEVNASIGYVAHSEPLVSDQKLGLKRLFGSRTDRSGHTFPLRASRARKVGPPAGGAAGKERRRKGYPATNGRAGGKLPAGKTALRSPCRS